MDPNVCRECYYPRQSASTCTCDRTRLLWFVKSIADMMIGPGPIAQDAMLEKKRLAQHILKCLAPSWVIPDAVNSETR